MLFSNVVNTMNEAPGKELPFVAFSLLRILNDGAATILSYEMPPPILLSYGYSTVLQERTITVEERIISEAHCELKPGEGILIVSDGITQAGIGKGLTNGWEISGVDKFINSLFRTGIQLSKIPEVVRQKAKEYWLGKPEDDCTAVIAYCRRGTQVNILTGAPASPAKDHEVVRNFIEQDGFKIVCGGTTAKIVCSGVRYKT